MNHPIQQFDRREIQNGFRQLISDFPEFVDLSRDTADDHGESHRDFIVGNVGLALKLGHTGLITVTGANFKVRHSQEQDEAGHTDPEHELELLHEEYGIPREAPAVCAEMATIVEAQDNELFFLAHITTASTDEEEIRAITGISTKTLPPCRNCTPVLDKSPSTSKATLYVAASLDLDICQVRNMRMLKRLHLKQQEKNLLVARFSPKISRRALEMFDRRTASHDFSVGLPSRALSSFAASAIMKAGTER